MTGLLGAFDIGKLFGEEPIRSLHFSTDPLDMRRE